MYISNKEKIHKLISLTNELYFKYNPPKKPFFLFLSQDEYRNKMIAEREGMLLSRLDDLMGSSDRIGFGSLWHEFGSRDDDYLLLQWIKVLSTKPEIAEANFHKLYKEGGEKLSEYKKYNAIHHPQRRVSYQPLTSYIISKLNDSNFCFESDS